MANMIKKIFASTVKAVDEAARTLQFTITTETEDRDGEVVKAAGGQFERYKGNPVVAWAHDYKALPVAKCIDLRIVGKTIVATDQFPTKDEYEYADTVYKLCKGGYLNAVSIGFIPIEVEKSKTDKGPSRTYTKWEMLEHSIVLVPSNPDALRHAVDDGLITVKEFEAVTKSVDYNSELSRNQCKAAFWQMLDTLAMCVSKTISDPEEADKPGTLGLHGDAFYTGYGKWIKDAKKAGVFDEQLESDGMMLSLREYFTKAQPKAEKKPGQTTIADEIDYLITLSKESGLSDENKLALKRLAGDDTPVQIKDAVKPATDEEIVKYIQESLAKGFRGGN